MDKLTYKEFLGKREELKQQYEAFLDEYSMYYQRNGEQEYLDLLRHILKNGTKKEDRTGTGTISIFGYQMRFNLADSILPVLTTKKVFLKSVITELLWFIAGDTNIRYLLQNGNNIWNDWPLETFIDSEEFKVIFPDADMTDWKHRKDTDLEFKENVYLPVLRYFKQQILEDDEFMLKFGSIGESGSYGANWRRFAGPDGKIVDQLSDVIEQIKNNPDSRRQIVSAWNPAEIDNAALPPCHTLFQFYVVDGKLSCQLYQR